MDVFSILTAGSCSPDVEKRNPGRSQAKHVAVHLPRITACGLHPGYNTRSPVARMRPEGSPLGGGSPKDGIRVRSPKGTSFGREADGCAGVIANRSDSSPGFHPGYVTAGLTFDAGSARFSGFERQIGARCRVAKRCADAFDGRRAGNGFEHRALALHGVAQIGIGIDEQAHAKQVGGTSAPDSGLRTATQGDFLRGASGLQRHC